jgi:hypothetical protein
MASCSNTTTVDQLSGIQGRVTSSPTCPVETVPPALECEPAPLVATLEVRDEDGNTLVRVTSGRDGRYRVALDPGQYLLHALPVSAPASFPWPPRPVEVSVRDRAWNTIDLDYDTGIR